VSRSTVPGRLGSGFSGRMLFVLAIAVQLVVLYAPRGTGGGIPYLDKVVHVAIFAAVVWAGRRAGIPGVVLAAIFLAHAVVSELVQAELLPGRSGSVTDVLADVAGVVLGLALPVRRGIIET